MRCCAGRAQRGAAEPPDALDRVLVGMVPSLGSEVEAVRRVPAAEAAGAAAACGMPYFETSAAMGIDAPLLALARDVGDRILGVAGVAGISVAIDEAAGNGPRGHTVRAGSPATAPSCLAALPPTLVTPAAVRDDSADA